MDDGLTPTDHRPVPVMTVAYARVIMQQHIDCPISVCALKRQAKRRLIECGVLVPAAGRHSDE